MHPQFCLILLLPHGLQPTRLFCPWEFLSKNTGMGCNYFLQGIFSTQGLNPSLLCLLHQQVDFFLSFFFFFLLTTEPPGKPKKFIMALLNEYFITLYMLEALVILEGYLTWQMKQFIMILVLCQFFQFFSFRINDTMFLGYATIDYKCILSR